MSKKKQTQQAAFAFHIEFKPVERNERHEDKVQRAEVLFNGELGLNRDWKNFGNYIKNLRGNKV